MKKFSYIKWFNMIIINLGIKESTSSISETLFIVRVNVYGDKYLSKRGGLGSH